jgi:hypothetical protein
MLINQALASYILAFMVAKYPVENHRFLGVTDEYTTARYETIAADIADVALDPDEPPVFRSKLITEKRARDLDGRVKTAVLMASVARFESGGYREDVDTLVKKGDNGHAVCLLQLHLWPGEVVTDRASCLRAGMRHLRASYKDCHDLSGYTVGHCVEHEPQADKRSGMAAEWVKAHPFVVPSGVLDVPEPEQQQGAKLLSGI